MLTSYQVYMATSSDFDPPPHHDIREHGSNSLFRDGQGIFDFAIVRYWHGIAKYTINLERSPAERLVECCQEYISTYVSFPLIE